MHPQKERCIDLSLTHTHTVFLRGGTYLWHILAHGDEAQVGRAAQAFPDPHDLAWAVNECAHNKQFVHFRLSAPQPASVSTRAESQQSPTHKQREKEADTAPMPYHRHTTEQPRPVAHRHTTDT
jgi:hypothetical protein